MYLKHTNLSLFRRAVRQTLDAVMYTAGRTQSMKSMIDGNRWHSMTIDAN